MGRCICGELLFERNWCKAGYQCPVWTHGEGSKGKLAAAIRRRPKLLLQFPRLKIHRIRISKKVVEAAYKPDPTPPWREARREKEEPGEPEEEEAGEEEVEEEGDSLVEQEAQEASSESEERQKEEQQPRLNPY